MADLVTFMRRDDIPVLTQAALAHAQFETIHPFTDGNGRTGRAMIHSILRARGLTHHVTVPVSAGLLTDTPTYFAALSRYRAGDAAEIVRLMATASLTALTNARQLVADLDDVRDRWAEAIQARRDASAWQLADLFLRQPVLDAATAQRPRGRLGQHPSGPASADRRRRDHRVHGPASSPALAGTGGALGARRFRGAGRSADAVGEDGGHGG